MIKCMICMVYCVCGCSGDSICGIINGTWRLGVRRAQDRQFLLYGCGHRLQYLALHADYAMFHIFAGPLFANLEGYAFLDLLIWGVSPVLFEALRVRLRRFVEPGRGRGA